MTDPKIVRHILSEWNIDAILDELGKQSWVKTEPKRIDRMVYVSPGLYAKNTAMSTVSKKEWAEASKEGFEHEIIEDYMDVLGEVLTRIFGSHVYMSQEEGDWFAGQYEDGDIEELRAAGYNIVE